MKRQKKLFSVILSLVFAVGMLFGGGALNVFAVNTTEITEDPTLSASFHVPARLAYMDKFTDAFPVDTTDSTTIESFFDEMSIWVTAPNGRKDRFHKDTTASDFTSFVFNQIGVYKFEYAKLKASGDSAVYGDYNLLYSKTAPCKVEGEFELRVDYDGADIPTYTKKNMPFKVPGAKLYFKGEEDTEFKPLKTPEDYTLKIETTARNADKTAAPGESLTVGADKSYALEGSYNIVYSAQLNSNGLTGDALKTGTNGAKHYSKSFDVRVQGGSFNHEKNPQLTVAGVPTTGSLNTKITLPVATAKDDYDEKVKVVVSVKHIGEDIPKAKVNEKTGFAVGPEKDGETVIIDTFDNVYTTSFYPLNTGRYEVVYYAVNDFGKESARSPFTILVEDRSSPTLQEIDDYQIPSEWGLETVKRAKTATEYFDKTKPANDPDNMKDRDGGKTVIFPLPEYIDNAAPGRDGVTRVGFEIKDTVNNFTVVRFHNIYATNGTDNAYEYKSNQPSNGYYRPSGTEEGNNKVLFMNHADGFEFDFEKYVDNLQAKNGTDKDGLGRYTAQYIARDAKDNITTKTYDITLSANFEDTSTPDVSVSFDDYIYFADDTKYFTVPTATITDSGTTRTKIDYTISTYVDDAADPLVVDSTNTLTVKSGEKLRVVREGGKVYLRNYDYIYATAAEKPDMEIVLFDTAKTPQAKTQLQFKVVAADSAGNVNDKEVHTVRLVLFENDSLKNMTLGIRTANISYDGNFGTTIPAGKGYAASTDYSVKFIGIGDIAAGPITGPTADNYFPNPIDSGIHKGQFNFGAFAITGVRADCRDFVGFEMKLTDADGKILDGISFETFYVSSRYNEVNGVANPEGMGMIVVDNITVGLPKADEAYTLLIRAFDINGKSVSKLFSISVAQGATEEDDNFDRSTPIGSEGYVNVTYTLKNQFSFKLRSDYDMMRQYMVRKITGVGNFSLMGAQFTAFSTGSCYFEEGYYAEPDTIAASSVTDAADYKNVEKAYDFNIDDNSDTLFEVQGVMPTYSKKSNTEALLLPSVVAHNEYANAVVKVEVKSPKDILLTGTSGATLGADNRYSFMPKEDGKYKITFTASINNSTARSETFVINVGDIVAPTFTVTPPSETILKLNDTKNPFKFSKMAITDDSDDIKTGANISEANKWDDIKFTKRLILPDGTTHALPVEWGKAAAERQWTTENDRESDKQASGYILTVSGTYKVEYIAEDRVGNQSKVVYEFTILGAGSSSRVPFRIISTVLIIVAILLIVGVILYFARFQKKKIQA